MESMPASRIVREGFRNNETKYPEITKIYNEINISNIDEKKLALSENLKDVTREHIQITEEFLTTIGIIPQQGTTMGQLLEELQQGGSNILNTSFKKLNKKQINILLSNKKLRKKYYHKWGKSL